MSLDVGILWLDNGEFLRDLLQCYLSSQCSLKASLTPTVLLLIIIKHNIPMNDFKERMT